MNGPEVVDVEVAIGSPSQRNTLSVFLHHPNPDGRIEAEAVAFTNGAEFVSHPDGAPPKAGSGVVEIKGSALYVSIGHLYVISPMTVKGEEVADLNEAIVYFTDRPFDPADITEKTWLAVHLPLVHSSEESA